MDSQMSCRYKFGLIVSPSDGAVLRLKPETKGPDNFSVITTTVFEINALVGGGSVFPGEGVRGRGTGLLFDGSAGTINDNKFMIAEIISCDCGIDLSAGTNNFIEVPLLHLCNTHLRVGSETSGAAAFNRIQTTLDSQGIEGSVGARIFGHHNYFTLNVARTAAEQNVIFEPTARENLIFALALPNGITNRATTPTNRILSAVAAGLSAQTPPVPASGETTTNRNPFPIDALIIEPGQVNQWELIDVNGKAQTIRAGFNAGQTLRLEPGESVRLTYTAAPVWRWRGVE
jgi:hypothetical protein